MFYEREREREKEKEIDSAGPTSGLADKSKLSGISEARTVAA